MSVHPEEGRHRGYVHVPDEDTSEVRTATPEQMWAIDLLELATPGCPLVRLTVAQWEWVDRVVGKAQGGIPAPRQAADDTEARR